MPGLLQRPCVPQADDCNAWCEIAEVSLGRHRHSLLRPIRPPRTGVERILMQNRHAGAACVGAE